MNVPVLTYHSMNINGDTYSQNDHLAFASDLETIHELGFRVISLRKVVDWQLGLLPDDVTLNAVAITFDDGSWFDFYDLDHPACGLQRSMFNIMVDHNAKHGSSHQAHATSFVISSPEARSSLDKSCMIGKDWWGDEWWVTAASSGIMDIECHSWDHVHPLLSNVGQMDQIKGDFKQVKSFIDSEIQFSKAGEYIGSVLGDRPSLFAYPYGSASDYVVNQYLPEHRSRHQFRAAFTTEPKAISKTDNRWLLPRFVCGHDWRSPEGLREILKNSQNGPML